VASSARQKKAEAAETATENNLGLQQTSPAFWMRVANDAAMQTFWRETARFDVGRGGYAAMSVIEANPGITQGQLGVLLGRHMSTLTPILRHLQLRGLILREPLPADRRSFALTLTPKGSQRTKEIRQIAERHERTLEQIVGEEQMPEFMAILRRIRENMS
jgi:DNA-binding MarR family transcriptional regulator